MNKIRLFHSLNNRGQVLFLSVLAATIIIIGLSASQFLKSIGENTSTRHDRDTIKALYAAEKGLEYIMEEIKNSSPDSTNWVTHKYNFGTEILDQVPTEDRPEIVLSSINEITTAGYKSKANQPIQFIAKIYNNPRIDNPPPNPPPNVDPANKIVLVKGFSGSKEILLAARLSATSLYEYFMFYPKSGLSFIGGNTYDAMGGKIHANGALTFYGGSKIKNISELSTSHYFRYGWSSYRTPMVDLDATPSTCGTGWTGMCVDANNKTIATLYNTKAPDSQNTTWAKIQGIDLPDGTVKWKTGICWNTSNPNDCLLDMNVTDQRLKYYNPDKWENDGDGSGDGYLSGDRWGLLCEKGTTLQFDWCGTKYNKVEGGDAWHKVDPILYPERYMYSTPTGNTLNNPALVTPYNPDPMAPVETVKIPNRLNKEWRRAKYMYDGTLNGKKYYNSQAYSFFPKDPYDPNDIQGTCTDDNICPKVKSLNTELQPNEWQAFLDSPDGEPLKGILLDSDTGGTSIGSPIVSAGRMRSMAGEKGILIENTISRSVFNDPVNRPSGFNKFYRQKDLLLDSTGGTVGNYQVKINNTLLEAPDAEGKIKVALDPDGIKDDIIFEKKGFYGDTESMWRSLVVMNMQNFNQAISQGIITAPAEGVTYSDWDIGLSQAQTLLPGGQTIVTEGNVYAFGSVNTVNYVPASIIPRGGFFPLSRDFNFPQKVPVAANYPDHLYVPKTEDANGNGILDAGEDLNGNGLIDTFDINQMNAQWRYDHREGTTNPMPNKVLQDEEYRISIVGERAAFMNNILYNTTYEMWNWRNNWLDLNETFTRHGKTYTGTIFGLPYSDFQDESSNPDPAKQWSFYNFGYQFTNVSRKCTPTECAAGRDANGFYHHHDNDYNQDYYWTDCTGCTSFCNPNNSYCQTAAALFPFGNEVGGKSPLFRWESEYLTGNLPPADLPGISIASWMILNNTQTNFDQHCQAVSVY